MKKEEILKLSRKERDLLREKIDHYIDILSLASERGFTVIQKGKNLSLQEHGSVFFYPETNTFHRYSSGWSGGPVSFLTNIENIPYLDALEILSEQMDPQLLEKEFVAVKRRNPFELGDSIDDQIRRHKLLTGQVAGLIDHNHYDHAKAYLINERQLHPDLVDKLIKEHEIYQSKCMNGHRYVFFIGHSEYGVWDAVCARDINSTFKRTYQHSNSKRGWFYDPQVCWQQRNQQIFAQEKTPEEMVDHTKQLLVFESSIEMMSYMSLLKVYGEDIDRFAYLSCGSISSWKAVIETCRTYGYRSVKVLFNNDMKKELEKGQNPGKEAAEKTVNALLEEGIHAEARFPTAGEDWNDCLKILLKERAIEYHFPLKGVRRAMERSGQIERSGNDKKKDCTIGNKQNVVER